MSASVLKTVFSVVDIARSPHATTSIQFTGQQVYRNIEDKDSLPWDLFLKHMDALASDRVQSLVVVIPYENEYDTTGGTYRVNYEGIVENIVEDTVAAFIDVTPAWWREA